MLQDELYMRKALIYAEYAASIGEVPVGAVVVYNDEIIGYGYNTRENDHSSIAHAEINAIKMACNHLNSWRLSGATLYVTLEPCPMCSGAIINSRIDRVVYGSKDILAGCCGSLIDLNMYPFNHSFKVDANVLEDECRKLLLDFFKKKR